MSKTRLMTACAGWASPPSLLVTGCGTAMLPAVAVEVGDETHLDARRRRRRRTDCCDRAR